MRHLLLTLATLSAAPALAATTVDYPIVAVRAPRPGDSTVAHWQDIMRATAGVPGSDLVLIHPDGSEEVLVEAGKDCLLDPAPSLDGRWVYYARIYNAASRNTQRGAWGLGLPRGCDIYKVHVETRQIVRLTHLEWTPNRGAAPFAPEPWGNQVGTAGEVRLGYGPFSSGPCPVLVREPDGTVHERVVFTSSRNSYMPAGSLNTDINLQLFIMDADGRNVECIGPMNLGSALHPVAQPNGRILFATGESQGANTHQRWSIWDIYPDGRKWEPVFSLLDGIDTMHFQTALTDERIVSILYYINKNKGLGTALVYHREPPPELLPVPRFGPEDRSRNKKFNMIAFGGQLPFFGNSNRYGFQPHGLHSLTPWASAADKSSYPDADGVRMGKVTHPSGAPDNDLLLVWSPGAAHGYGSSGSQGVIALLKGGQPTDHPRDLVILKNDPAWNYQQPKALVPFARIYGREMEARPWLPNDGSLHPLLPAGTPFTLVGTSSCLNRSSKRADVGAYSDDEVHSIRIVQQEPTSHWSYWTTHPTWQHEQSKGWRQPVLGSTRSVDERLRILGEVPLRKFDAAGQPVLDPTGTPDTSFLARIPADVPYTFQLLDSEGYVLTNSKTWHQGRPGEVRRDCGGCHAHDKPGVPFELTFAATDQYAVPTFDQKPRDVEYWRDVHPILAEKWPTVLAENETVEDALVKPLHARQSELIWRMHGRRMDGRSEAWESPEPVPPLTPQEQRTIAEWIDLGATRNVVRNALETDDPWDDGYFLDDLKPTLTLQSPARHNAGPVDVLRFGAFDGYSGLDRESIRVVADVQVAGRDPGSNLADLFTEQDSIWTLDLARHDSSLTADGRLVVVVRDVAGNEQMVDRHYEISDSTEISDSVEKLKARIHILEGEVALLADEKRKTLEALRTVVEQLER